MKMAMRWDFSRVLAVIGLFAGVARVALAWIQGESGDALLGAVGTGILFLVGGLLIGAALDTAVRVRRRGRSRDHEGHRVHRKR